MSSHRALPDLLATLKYATCVPLSQPATFAAFGIRSRIFSWPGAFMKARTIWAVLGSAFTRATRAGRRSALSVLVARRNLSVLRLAAAISALPLAPMLVKREE